MINVFAKCGMTALLTCATVVLSPGLAGAAGQFDGTWVIDAPASGGRTVEGRPTCPALRLPIQVSNNQISGNLARSTANRTEVVASQGRGSSPIRGSVLADGTFAADWQNFHIAGKITGDTMTAYWNGQCGPRSAQGTRVQ